MPIGMDSLAQVVHPYSVLDGPSTPPAPEYVPLPAHIVNNLPGYLAGHAASTSGEAQMYNEQNNIISAASLANGGLDDHARRDTSCFTAIDGVPTLYPTIIDHNLHINGICALFPGLRLLTGDMQEKATILFRHMLSTVFDGRPMQRSKQEGFAESLHALVQMTQAFVQSQQEFHEKLIRQAEKMDGDNKAAIMLLVEESKSDINEIQTALETIPTSANDMRRLFSGDGPNSVKSLLSDAKLAIQKHGDYYYVSPIEWLRYWCSLGLKMNFLTGEPPDIWSETSINECNTIFDELVLSITDPGEKSTLNGCYDQMIQQRNAHAPVTTALPSYATLLTCYRGFEKAATALIDSLEPNDLNDATSMLSVEGHAVLVTMLKHMLTGNISTTDTSTTALDIFEKLNDGGKFLTGKGEVWIDGVEIMTNAQNQKGLKVGLFQAFAKRGEEDFIGLHALVFCGASKKDYRQVTAALKRDLRVLASGIRVYHRHLGLINVRLEISSLLCDMPEHAEQMSMQQRYVLPVLCLGVVKVLFILG